MKDKLIVKYIKKCNQKGVEMLIDNYNSLLTSVVRTHLNPLLMYEEECISDVIFLIWENIEGFDSKKNTFKNWICAIAKYKAIDYKRKYLSKINLEIKDNTFYIDENLLQIEVKEELEEILNFLNCEDRELFIKYYLEGYKLEEIANNTDTSVNNLHARLSRGRKKIRKNIFRIGG